jgi:hypothetical protein
MTIEKARMIAASSRYRDPRTLRDAALEFIKRNDWATAQRLAERATASERRSLTRGTTP